LKQNSVSGCDVTQYSSYRLEEKIIATVYRPVHHVAAIRTAHGTGGVFLETRSGDRLMQTISLIFSYFLLLLLGHNIIISPALWNIVHGVLSNNSLLLSMLMLK